MSMYTLIFKSRTLPQNPNDIHGYPDDLEYPAKESKDHHTQQTP